MRPLHLPVAAGAGADTRLDEALGRGAEVGAEVRTEEDVAAAEEEADWAGGAEADGGGEPAAAAPEPASATRGGPGSVKDLNPSAQMSGNFVLS